MAIDKGIQALVASTTTAVHEGQGPIHAGRDGILHAPVFQLCATDPGTERPANLGMKAAY